MNKISLTAQQRSQTGKGPARRLRAAGKVPAIFYGGSIDPIKLTLDIHEFTTSYDRAGANPLFNLNIDDDGNVTRRLAILKERQADPVTGNLIHLDFIEIFMDQAIEVTIPVEFDGKPVGVEKGGVFQTAMRDVRVSCLPDNIPESFQVDISNMEVGDSLHVGSLQLPEGVELVDDPNLGLASVVAPTQVVEEEPEEGEEEAAGEEVSEVSREGEEE